MATGTDDLLLLPNVICPGCGLVLAIDHSKFIRKYSVRQIKAMCRYDTLAEEPARTFTVVTCQNIRCERYNKFKVWEIPRAKMDAISVDLEKE